MGGAPNHRLPFVLSVPCIDDIRSDDDHPAANDEVEGGLLQALAFRELDSLEATRKLLQVLCGEVGIIAERQRQQVWEER